MRVLGLRVEAGLHGPRRASVTVLVDGRDLLGSRGYLGADRDELLRHPSPLLPSHPPRRVVIGRCRCGHAACESVAPLVVLAGDLVRWRDFRSYAGLDELPELVDDPGRRPPEQAEPGIPDVVFDAGQYRAEVARVSANPC